MPVRNSCRFHLCSFLFLFLAAAFLCPVVLSAQRPAALIRKGDEAMLQADYYTALYYFRQAYAGKPAPDIALRLAEAAYAFQAFPVAETHFTILTQGNAVQQFPTAWLGLGKSQFAQGNYKAAKESLVSFLATNQGRKQQMMEAQRIVASCAWAINQEATTEWKLERMSRRLNSPYAEFGAWKSGDTLYYTSYRYQKEDDTYQPPRKISKVLISKDERRGRLLSRGFNEDTIHTAHVALNQKKDLLFFNRCQFTEGAKLHCKLCVRKKDRRGRWEKQFLQLPQPVNLPAFTATQPAVLWDSTTQKEYLLFVSDRPGTKGGFDIWQVSIPDDLHQWEVPTALTALNTAANEVTPMYAVAEQQLYFGTDRSPGFGGYDLVRAPYKGQLEWGRVKNLGPAFNSSYDDTYPFAWGEDRLYFSSNRPGGRYLDPDSKSCCPDLFRADKTPLPSSVLDTITSTDNPPVTTAPLQPARPTEPVFRTLEDFLPLTLFYDNDQPDPRTRKAVTKHSYEETYFDYLRREDEYYDEYAESQEEQDALARFFEEGVVEGYDRLERFSTILLAQLQAGQQVEIFLKGYTSPRAQGDYNLLLGKRRVSAVRNHFERWRSGQLLDYIKREQLVISEVSFGETKAAASARDERAGERLSIYSPQAARERRVEIVEVRRGEH